MFQVLAWSDVATIVEPAELRGDPSHACSPRYEPLRGFALMDDEAVSFGIDRMP